MTFLRIRHVRSHVLLCAADMIVEYEPPKCTNLVPMFVSVVKLRTNVTKKATEIARVLSWLIVKIRRF